MKASIGEIIGPLESEMLQAGGKLPALDRQQISENVRNKKSEGGATAPATGVQTMSTTTEETKSSKKSEKNDVPAAGGKEEATREERILKMLEKLEERQGWKSRAIDIAIPTGIAVAGVVAGYGAVTLIQKKWGNKAPATALPAAPAVPAMK